MTNETAIALNELSRRIFETEQKLDNYFKMLHDQNAEKINMIATAADDQMALRSKGLYQPFEEVVNTYQHKGLRVVYQDVLYKLTCEDQTADGTYVVENWTPTEAASIWTPIDEEHAGTLKDPIPAKKGMEYQWGKYYIEDGKLYFCNRQGGKEGDVYRLDYLPSLLVGQYFELV